MFETTLPDLVADLVALRHAGGYRFKVQQRVLRQFVEYCRREGYSDGSITKEALDGFLYGRHLRVSLVEFIRPERKFSGLDALKAQIAEDAQKARTILAGALPG